MRLLVLLLALLVHQEPMGGITKGGGAGVSVDGAGTNLVSNTAGGSACANGTASTACALGSITIPTTGDTVDVVLGVCWNSGCTINTGGTMSITDSCSNSYVSNSVASSNNATFVSVYRFEIVNATAATCSLTAHNSGAVNWYYARASVVYVKGANASSPVDVNISNVAVSASGSPSITSSANVTGSGEVAIAVVPSCGVSDITNSGSYTTLFHNATDHSMTAYYLNPTSGATTTASFTCTSGGWTASLAGYKQ